MTDVDDAIKRAEGQTFVPAVGAQWAKDARVLAAEVQRLQNALLWIRYQAALHHLGGAFEPVHMLAIANTAGDALSGRDDMPDFDSVIEAAQEKATEWAEKYAELANEEAETCGRCGSSNHTSCPVAPWETQG